MDGVQNSRIENNLLYNNHASGISLYSIDGGGGSTGNVVVNNTVLPGRATAAGRSTSKTAAPATRSATTSCSATIRTRGAIDISADSLPGFTSDYNVVISRFTTNGGNSIRRSPNGKRNRAKTRTRSSPLPPHLFVNPAGDDYHLQTGSPAINAGTSSFAPPVDLDGLPRPAGGAFDIGAFEFGAAARRLQPRWQSERRRLRRLAQDAWRQRHSLRRRRRRRQRHDRPGRLCHVASRLRCGVAGQRQVPAHAIPEPTTLIAAVLCDSTCSFRARFIHGRIPAPTTAPAILLRASPARPSASRSSACSRWASAASVTVSSFSLTPVSPRPAGRSCVRPL